MISKKELEEKKLEAEGKPVEKKPEFEPGVYKPPETYVVEFSSELSDELICPLCNKPIENPFPGQPINWHIQICWACGRYCCENCSNIRDAANMKLKKGEEPPSPLGLV